ncbi:MAG TPA: phosphatase PAP2 family protein [Pseudonocardiaceae bacterium]|nr:phosphatase PAP2 family protein [Pseudonocardiaceae bacterium]
MVPEPDAYRPLLVDRARGPAGVVILLAVVVIAVLGMRYANQDAAGRLDLTLDSFISTHIRRDEPITGALVSLGDLPQAAILVAVVAGAAARRWSGVVLTIGGTLTAVTITELILKPLIGRLRYGHLSFPSGHTTALFSVAIAAAILLTGARRPRNVGLRLVASLAAVVVAAGTAIALVARHVHYATDTVAGCCVAVATMLAVALALDFVAPRPRFDPSQNGSTCVTTVERGLI